ncbi:MAG: DotU family type IV/VI secretion system protein [Planctomycetes bacterium]|nr:DotU family type IV/VI secretion system protein [Planctomycetota bacterium]
MYPTDDPYSSGRRGRSRGRPDRADDDRDDYERDDYERDDHGRGGRGRGDDDEGQTVIGRPVGRRQRSGTTLVELTEPLFALVITLRESDEIGSAAKIRQAFRTLAAQLRERADAAGLDPERVEHALYAIARLVDETVLGSHSDAALLWRDEPLDERLPDEGDGGVRVFDQLQATMGSTQHPESVDLLEVYLHCLAHGLRGMYGARGQLQQLHALRQDLARTIRRARRGADAELPLCTGVKPASQLARLRRSVPTWAFVALILSATLVVMWIMADRAAGVRDEAVRGLGPVVGSAAGDGSGNGNGTREGGDR